MTLPDVGTPPVAEVNASAVERATALAPEPSPALAAPNQPGAAPNGPGAAEPPKKKRGQRGPDKAPRQRKKADAQEFKAAREALTVPTVPGSLSSDPSPADVARVARGLTQLSAMLGNVFAATLDVKPLAPDEATALGDAWAEILAPYMREDAGGTLKFITAAAVTAGVVLPRAKEAKARKLAKAAPITAVVAQSAPLAAPAAVGGPIRDAGLGQ